MFIKSFYIIITTESVNGGQVGKKNICCAFFSGLLLFGILINVNQAMPSESYNISSFGTIHYSSNPLLSVDGKQIVDNSGTPVFLRGLSKMGLEYANPVTRNDREIDPTYYEYDAEVMVSWGANLVRVSFCKEWYDNDPQYRVYLRQWVDACASRGLYIILDCHYPSPMGSLIRPDTPEDEANAIMEGMIATQEQVVRNYADQNMVIGVEINEPWLMDAYPDKMWSWLLRINNLFAQRIHAINPDLLIFIDVANLQWINDSVINASRQYLTEPNLVLAPHLYEAERGFPYTGKYYPNDGGDFMTYYEQGDNAEGKRRLYQFLDVYYKQPFDLYGLPVVATEFAGKRTLTQPLRDIMAYMNSQGYGYSYWTYYGGTGSYLLETDWQTLSPTGSIFVEGL